MSKLENRKNNLGVLILTPFFSPNIGGVETHLDDLVEALDEKDYRVYVQTYSPLTTPNVLWSKNEKRGSNISITRYKWLGKDLFHKLENFPILNLLYLVPYLFLRIFFFMMVHGRKIDIIHAQGFNAGLIGIVLKVLFRKRFLMSLHAVYPRINGGGLGLMIRFMLQKSGIVLGMSKAVLKQFAKLGFDEKQLGEYRYWVNVERFQPMDKKEARGKTGVDDRFTVLFVGRLLPIKGVELLANVAKELKDIQFVFIGTGPLEGFLKDIAAKHSNVHFPGKIPNTDLAVYYNSSDLFCIPSQYEEGLGRVVMEAVACGVPIVGANRGGIPEVLNDTVSLLVEPSHENIKQAITTLHVDQGKLEALRVGCRAHALSHYSKKNVDLITKYYA